MTKWVFGDPNKPKEVPSEVQQLAERQYQKMLKSNHSIERNQRPRSRRKPEDHIR